MHVDLNDANMNRALELRDFRSVRMMLRGGQDADIADVCEALDVASCVLLFRLTPQERRANVFSYLNQDVQESLLASLPSAMAASLLNDMEADDRTRLFEGLSAEIRSRALLLLDPAQLAIAKRLLAYPEGSVGRMMTPDCVTLASDLTVEQALEQLHWNDRLPAEYLHYLFVVDPAHRLLGETTLAQLVTSDPRSRALVDVMKTTHITLDPQDDGESAVEIFRKYDIHFIPVTAPDQTLLGIVTSDDVFEFAEEEATEDIHQFGGHGALENEYFQTPFWVMIRKRAPWLCLLFLGGFLTGEALKSAGSFLDQWGFLVFFLPTINSAGGNSGTQTASLIIRAMAINEVSGRDVWRVLRKELAVGLALGLLLATLGVIRALSWSYSFKIAAIIACAVVAVVVTGVMVGAMLPFLFRMLRLDPAVVSSPFISTLMDVSGVWLLFSIARTLLHVFGLSSPGNL